MCLILRQLAHGVTRERLESQVRENGGYHVVHWSGHGHLNLLELARPGGTSDHLSGDELLDLFTQAGGFLPRLFFLSACHAGLECGVIAQTYPGLDMISFGPDIEEAHSENERASISSAQKFWKLLTTTLARL